MSAGPVVSVRLKVVRDGMEDYELLKLVEAKEGRAAADRVCRKVIRDFFDWESDPKKIEAAREELLEILEEE